MANTMVGAPGVRIWTKTFEEQAKNKRPHLPALRQTELVWFAFNMQSEWQRKASASNQESDAKSSFSELDLTSQSAARG